MQRSTLSFSQTVTTSCALADGDTARCALARHWTLQRRSRPRRARTGRRGQPCRPCACSASAHNERHQRPWAPRPWPVAGILQRLEPSTWPGTTSTTRPSAGLVARPGLPELVGAGGAGGQPRRRPRRAGTRRTRPCWPADAARSPALDCRATTSRHRLQALLACPRLVPLVSLNLSGNALGDAGLIALTVARLAAEPPRSCT